MHRGYIKLYRKIRDNPRFHDPDYLALWIWLLVETTKFKKNSIFGGKSIILAPGQLTTGRKQLSELSGISESKITRLLNLMQSEQQINQQTSNTNRLISITNWNDYQESDQQNEQQMNNKRTTDEQQVNTPKEVKEDIYCDCRQEIIDYLNIKLKSHYRPDSEGTAGYINARLKAGFTVQDFKRVIDKKTAQWLSDEKMVKFLRPITLFSPEHFENYLNEPDQQVIQQTKKVCL
jgi:uncharacterized phage protein (TIGR02220 family)